MIWRIDESERSQPADKYFLLLAPEPSYNYSSSPLFSILCLAFFVVKMSIEWNEMKMSPLSNRGFARASFVVVPA
jgi:hypothetical protein